MHKVLSIPLYIICATTSTSIMTKAQTQVYMHNFCVPFIAGCAAHMFPAQKHKTVTLNIFASLGSCIHFCMLNAAAHDNYYPIAKISEYPLPPSIEYEKNNDCVPLQPPSKLVSFFGFTLGSVSGHYIKKYLIPAIVTSIKWTIFSTINGSAL